MNSEKRKEFLKEYDQKFKELTQKLIPFLIDFDRKGLELSQSNHPKYIIRDSIFYRCESVRFHLDLILQIHESVLKQRMENFPHNEDPILLMRGTDQVMYVFDDIVFNLCSMLDYLGNLIGLLYIGKNKMKIKWNGIAKAAMDDNNKFSKTLVAAIIQEQHRNLIDRLFGYRSRLIHHKKDKVGSKTSINFDVKNQKLGFGFSVDIPKEVLKILKKISKDELNDELTIFNVAIFLSEEILDIVNNIIIKTKEECEPKIKKEINEKVEKLKKESPELFE